MSFLNGLKKAEQFLSTLADNLTGDSHLAPTSIVENNAVLNNHGEQSKVSQRDCLEATHSMAMNPIAPSLDPLPPLPTIITHLSMDQYYTNILQNIRDNLNERDVSSSLAAQEQNDICAALSHELIAIQRIRNDPEQSEMYEKDLEEAKCVIARIAKPILEELQNRFVTLTHQEQQHDEAFPHWQIQLMQGVIITTGRSSIISYALTSQECLQQVQDFLESPTLMKLVLKANGPKNFNYASFLNIYHDILKSCPQAVNEFTNNIHHSRRILKEGRPTIYSRLALAVALEHACPICIFDTKIPIDPVQRYQHYKDAMESNDLDPAFTSFSVWELRMVVSCNASHEELSWFRSMLRNYRPDLVHLNNYNWRYAQIVRSDVVYKCPVWEPGQPKTYQQLLSGGGKCGPRAWMGRMACQAFGIPIWGVRQPGHAAMSHWTPYDDGWTICLGGNNWTKSFWEGRNGLDFQLETRARKFGCDYLDCGSLTGYDFVLVLKWLGYIQRERVIDSQSASYLQRQVRTRLWFELALLQCRMLHEERDCAGYIPSTNHLLTQRMNLILKDIKERSASLPTLPTLEPDDYIIPAANFIREGREQKVIISKSDQEDSGLQVHLKTEGPLRYEIELPDINKQDQHETSRYTIQVLVVTVQSDTTPLRLGIRNECNDFKKECMIHIPYTHGAWKWTEPIEVELGANSMNYLSFYRRGSNLHGLTMKYYYLRRIHYDEG